MAPKMFSWWDPGKCTLSLVFLAFFRSNDLIEEKVDFGLIFLVIINMQMLLILHQQKSMKFIGQINTEMESPH